MHGPSGHHWGISAAARAADMIAHNRGSVMQYSTAAAIGILMACATCTAHADTVTDWNQTAIEVMRVANVAGNPWSRTLAMVHVAMADAINAVQGRYTRSVATIPAVPRASA